MRSQISNLKFQMGATLLLLVLTGAAAASKSDTVVLGLDGNDTFKSFKDQGYNCVSTEAEALAFFTDTNPYTTLIVCKKSADINATGSTVGDWNFAALISPPGKMTRIEGGSPNKPYDVKLQGMRLVLNNFGAADKPFIFVGVTLWGAENAVVANGTSNLEMDQCYVRNNNGHGVVVVDNAVGKFVNCVFVENEDGIRVGSVNSSDNPSAEITHCTFYDSHVQGSGIHVVNYGKAVVKNTLMYRTEGRGVFDESTSQSTTVADSIASGNGLGDFVPATLATGNHTNDVAVLDSPWKGKLANVPQNLILPRGAGGAAALDFEGEGRSTSSPFIGADELNIATAIGFWTKCEIVAEPIGRKGADVFINYSGGIPDKSNSLCLVPDGVDITDLAHDIDVPLEGGDGTYWGRIPQIKDPILGTSTDGRTYIADSDNAQLVLRLGGGQILDVGDENQYIFGQAIDGHKGIQIDTIPPVVDLTVYSPVQWNFATESATTTPTGNWAARGNLLPPEAFPYPAIDSDWPQMSAPASIHGIFAPQPPSYVFNVGSASNGYITNNDWLFLTITANFTDPDVYTARGLTPDAAYPRTPTGFNSVAAGTETGSPTKYLTEAAWAAGLPAALLLSEGNERLADPAFASFSCSGTGATTMTATWEVAIPVTLGSWIRSFHMVGDFVSQDKAGNMFDVQEIDHTVLPPVQISWMSGYGNKLDFRTRMYGAWPEVAWTLNDSGLGLNRAEPLNPRPLYSYKIWGARSFGLYGSDPVFQELTPWTAWDPKNVLNASFFDQNISDNFGQPITDRWLILVVAGCDEAGNLTPWDGYGGETQTLALNADGSITLLDFSKSSGRNWIRFFIPGKTMQIDTVLYANLYYYEEATGARRDFGPAPIVSYPPPGVRLMAEFNSRLLVNDPALWASTVIGVKFTASENGAQVFPVGFEYVESQGSESVPFWLPYNGLPVELGSASNVMTYTVSAAAVADKGYEDELLDQTPATFTFKVVPGSVDDYLRSGGGQQPVKQFETR